MTVPRRVSFEYHLCSVHVPYSQRSIGVVQYFANFALPLEHLQRYPFLCNRQVQHKALPVMAFVSFAELLKTATYLVHRHKSNPTLPQHFCFHVPTILLQLCMADPAGCSSLTVTHETRPLVQSCKPAGYYALQNIW